jgi:hypothetical protein
MPQSAECGIASKIEDAMAKTIVLNRELARGSDRDEDIVERVLAFMEDGDILGKPDTSGPELQITALKIGCDACQDSCTVNMMNVTTDRTLAEVSVPPQCHATTDGQLLDMSTMTVDLSKPV